MSASRQCRFRAVVTHSQRFPLVRRLVAPSFDGVRSSVSLPCFAFIAGHRRCLSSTVRKKWTRQPSKKGGGGTNCDREMVASENTFRKRRRTSSLATPTPSASSSTRIGQRLQRGELDRVLVRSSSYEVAVRKGARSESRGPKAPPPRGKVGRSLSFFCVYVLCLFVFLFLFCFGFLPWLCRRTDRDKYKAKRSRGPHQSRLGDFAIARKNAARGQSTQASDDDGLQVSLGSLPTDVLSVILRKSLNSVDGWQIACKGDLTVRQRVSCSVFLFFPFFFCLSIGILIIGHRSISPILLPFVSVFGPFYLSSCRCRKFSSVQ